MAKKSGSGRKHKQQDHELVAARKQARVAKITGLEDAGFTGQDAFQLGDDEVSLEPGYNASTYRDNDDSDLDLQQDEVLALDLPTTRKQKQKRKTADTDAPGLEEEAIPAKSSRKSFKENKDLLPLTTARTSRFAAVQNDSEQEGESGSESESSENDEQEETEETAVESDNFNDEWARTGGYHVSKGEIARAEDRQGRHRQTQEEEERDQLDLYETRRIQQEAKADLDDEDYGLDGIETQQESMAGVTDADASSAAPVVVSVLPKFATRAEAVSHLISKEPELLALLDDFSASSSRLAAVKADLKTAQVDDGNPKVGFSYLYAETLSTYLTTLAYYLHLRSHPSYPSVAKDIYSEALLRLVKLREALSTLEDLGLVTVPGLPSSTDPTQSYMDDEPGLEALDREQLMSQLGDLEEDEIQALMDEREALLAYEGLEDQPKSKKRKHADSSEDSARETSIPEPNTEKKRKRRRGKKAAPATTVQDSILNLSAIPIKSASTSAHNVTAESDFLDPTGLSAADASDKASRKKSLRFYTSKIEAKSNKRSGASKERAGGDDDLPYRSKERARAAALQKQQHSQEIPENAELDGADYNMDDLRDADAVTADADAEGYYDLVASGKRAAKAAKQQAYDAAVLDDRLAVQTSQPLDPNNPRAVNRQIMANKGLTPKRPKAVRNPRVKKRMAYEKAQQKVASMKPVYKGGLGNASYEGEKSGISSKVVKSRAL